MIPPAAPFSPEQRAWLNGFFAGLMNLAIPPHEQQRPGDGDSLARQGVTQTETDDTSGQNEDLPWHDPALDLEERLKLAEGQPVSNRLMAAMAQLDCGACGYDCQRYSQAIAEGAEKRLNLCVPGGKATTRALKRILAEAEADCPTKTESSGASVDQAADAVTALVNAPVDRPSVGYDASSPVHAKFIAAQRLTAADSEKDIRHVVIELNGAPVDYEAGDALGIFPTNCPQLVDDVLATLGADGGLPVTIDGKVVALRESLLERLCLKDPSDELIELVCQHATSEEQRRWVQGLLDGSEDEASPDVLDVLRCAAPGALSAQQVVDRLQRLQPRLYSIASSPKKHAREVHLTVGKVAWQCGDRWRKGVASTFLAERAEAKRPLRVFVKKSHGFRLPVDGSTDCIMVGPGTGIAPFIGFLEEREASGCSGRNWLFFGAPHERTDFLYKDRLVEWQQTGLLTRLDTAFSRDQAERIYVQHRMEENAAELWSWLQRGAHFYVCGDASRMARDVDRTLKAIIARQGAMSHEQAEAYLRSIARQGRYQRDVY
ncbi:MAG: sulfite reductase subunit alpha [Planctomycetota bacterium]|nr:MAG: sulfite reductase subunit alpha [Planctomycetota bacterium]